MLKYSKNQRTVIFLILLESIVLTVIFLLISNNAFAQTLHNRTLYNIVNQNSELAENPQIDVRNGPRAIGIHERTNKVYVANSASNTISVISGDTNTKIKDISVGEYPVAIAIDTFRDKVYVANFRSASLSVISTATDTKMDKDIPVGEYPGDIVIDENIYVLHQGSNSISVIDSENYTKIREDIPLEHNPYSLGIVEGYLFDTTKLYVGYSDYHKVSVIDAENGTKIAEDIPIGTQFTNPLTDIGVHKFFSTVYVTNFVSDTVSVINGKTNKWIKDIPVEKYPSAIGINTETNLIYITNSGSDSVSVINGTNNNKIKNNIPVGKSPMAIGINESTNTVYAANLFSNGVSVIDGVNNTLVAKILVNVNPFNSGSIECDGLKTPINQFFYLWPGSNCIAKPNNGFEFQSWEENLNENSTIIIQSSSDISNTIFDFIANSLDSLVTFFGLKPALDSIVNFLNIETYEPEAILEITKFGTFTANFRELPPPLPPEYVATLLSVVATAFIGSWLTPTIIGWRKAKKHQNKLNDYQNELKDLHKGNKLDKNDINNLDNLREKVIAAYCKGDLTKDQYDVLLNNVSTGYNEIFQNRIKLLKNTNNNDEKIKLLDEIQSDLNDAYLKKKIDKDHYDLLKEMISELENNNNNDNSK